jgi:hypothetical protein
MDKQNQRPKTTVVIAPECQSSALSETKSDDANLKMYKLLSRLNYDYSVYRTIYRLKEKGDLKVAYFFVIDLPENDIAFMYALAKTFRLSRFWGLFEGKTVYCLNDVAEKGRAPIFYETDCDRWTLCDLALSFSLGEKYAIDNVVIVERSTITARCFTPGSYCGALMLAVSKNDLLQGYKLSTSQSLREILFSRGAKSTETVTKFKEAPLSKDASEIVYHNDLAVGYAGDLSGKLILRDDIYFGITKTDWQKIVVEPRNQPLADTPLHCINDKETKAE